jgi:hypothetical protein
VQVNVGEERTDRLPLPGTRVMQSLVGLILPRSC